VVHIHTGTSANVRALCWEIGLPKEIENNQLRYSYDDGISNSGLETDGQGQLVSYEEYYPYGGTAIWFSQNALEATYKTIRYSGKEKDATGLYYYGYRYYQPWVGRWLSADPAGTVDGLNLYRMVRNNPVTLYDPDGRKPKWLSRFLNFFKCGRRRPNSVVPSPIELNTTRESVIKPSTSGYLMHGLPTESKLATSIPSTSGIESFIQEHSSGDAWDNKRDEHYTVSELNVSERTKFKLFSTREGQSKNLIIFAHGHFDSRTRDINVPEGVTLNFLNPHDTVLTIQNPSIVTVAAKRDYTFASVSNTGVTAKTKNAEKILAEKGVLGITGSSEPNKVKDYQLSPHMDFDDTVYGNAISLNRYAETIGYKMPTLKSDILTLDKSTPKTPLQVVLNGLKNKGINYDTITCSFCRSSENSPKYNIYHSIFIRK
ncbi:RHS repeat-associated core domain-containing protein, partial [Proteus cibi]|uniref:RHS repeat-associated core domain-containing protein n=1 Tax=Proteus cibi TaxID=2050966 RepID=UPI0032DB6CC8